MLAVGLGHAAVADATTMRFSPAPAHGAVALGFETASARKPAPVVKHRAIGLAGAPVPAQTD